MEWDSIDFEEPEWVGAGLVSGGYLVYRDEDGAEVFREWYDCGGATEIARINAVLRQIHGTRFHGSG